MPLYAYKCNRCHQHFDSTTRADTRGTCVVCGQGEMRRQFAVNMQRPMQEHFNHTVNKPISDPKQFKRELREAGERYTETTGIACDYQPIDWADMGATEEGLDKANTDRSRQGLAPLRLPS